MSLIIHHWDTDGICAASMLYDTTTENMTPKIGNYYLEKDELAWIADNNIDDIKVVDMALHETSLTQLREYSSVTVFDHHHTKKIEGITYINPIIEGEREEEDSVGRRAAGSIR